MKMYGLWISHRIGHCGFAQSETGEVIASFARKAAAA
jgi:hypothetical protein